MGGKGSGGRRSRAGRPPKSIEGHFVAGTARGDVARILAHPRASMGEPAGPPEIFDPPAMLSADERALWLALAPQAFRAGTLTRATELAFVLLCRNIVLERDYGKSVTDRGTANHRGMIQRVEGGLDAFRLRPQGRPMPSAQVAKPASKLDRFLNRG